MLVASIVGVDMRATMDIDTTVKALPLNEKDARAIIERIGELQLEDGITFKIKSVKEIMEDKKFGSAGQPYGNRRVHDRP